jgi:alpha-1,2-mannosyltransferase
VHQRLIDEERTGLIGGSTVLLPDRHTGHSPEDLSGRTARKLGSRKIRRGVAGLGAHISDETVREWLPAALSALGALGLSLYLATRSYQVDIDVYRMAGQHALSPNLYSERFGNSGLVFTYTPFAALVFALLGLNLGIWSLQVVWAVGNIVALGALIYLSLRITVRRMHGWKAVRWAMLLLLPALALNPVFNTVGLGQINLVLCLLITWDLGTNRQIGGRAFPGGVATGLAAAVKLTPIIFVPYLIITCRRREARNAVVTFVACQALAFVFSPHNSWSYWTKDVFDSRRAGALLYSSDQNLSSVLQRFHHGPVSALVLMPLLIVVGAGGVALAGWAYRQSSAMLGLLVCATTGLIVSPITWVHHMVWVVPAIVWLAAGSDRPKRGPVLAGFATLLFIVAPIWWVPSSWAVTKNVPELHQNHWQLLLGNSFFFAMVAFLAGVGIMLVHRSSVSVRAHGYQVPPQEVVGLRRATTPAADFTNGNAPPIPVDV